jgi:DNA-binding transcriptional regulator YdaS (Cro superfamily)
MPHESRLETSAAKAVRAAGGQTALARKLGIAQSTVATWLARGNELPAKFVIPVEQAFGISRHDLRPDLYPLETPAPPARYAAGQPPVSPTSPPLSEETGGSPSDPLSGIAA